MDHRSLSMSVRIALGYCSVEMVLAGPVSTTKTMPNIQAYFRIIPWEEEEEDARSFSGFTALCVRKVSDPAPQAVCIKLHVTLHVTLSEQSRFKSQLTVL